MTRELTVDCYWNNQSKVVVHLEKWAIVGQTIQPLKRRRKVSSANVESEPPYKKPSPYLWVYGNERDDNVKVRCGSSRVLGYREPLADIS